MKDTIFYKIFKEHLLSGELAPGQEIGIKIDQTLTQDATGTLAYLQFESMEIPRVKTELSVSYVDHNMIQMGFENADDHKYLQTMNANYGIYFSRPGNGICHQVHLERFSKPGATLLGSDSHTPTCGAMGMIAIGSGGLEVAVAMSGGPFFLTCPKVINIRFSGKLRPWISAKDVILKALELLTTRGNVGTVIEYSGEGIKSLSVPERATITNMGAELGITTSLFPSDEIAMEFLSAQGRESVWREIIPGENAEYDRTIEIDLSSVVPLAACPHSPDNVKPVSELKGMKVDQVAVGSCTNSSFKDLMITAGILKGKQINPDVSLIIAPGSKQVLEMIARNGALADLLSSGARIMESACGFCIGVGQSPGTESVSLRTNNRNFKGRSGTESAGIYLVSPETAALSAINGKIMDPLDLPVEEYPKITIPEKFPVDDSLIIPPSDKKTRIIRGPNIGEPPEMFPLMNNFNGIIGLKVGDKITTDHIMPAGEALKYRSNIPKYSRFVFSQIDPTFSIRTLTSKKNNIYTAIAGGESYGQGSSREHAAICPMYLGVRIVIAKSFERIHASNLINFGIVPLVFENKDDYESILFSDDFSIENFKKQINDSNRIKIIIAGKAYYFSLSVSQRQRKILLKGGLLNYTRSLLNNLNNK